MNLVQVPEATDAEVHEDNFFVGAAEIVLPAAILSAEAFSAGLVSSPGYGVVDSGCGRTLIGRETLDHLTRAAQGQDRPQAAGVWCSKCFQIWKRSR